MVERFFANVGLIPNRKQNRQFRILVFLPAVFLGNEMKERLCLAGIAESKKCVYEERVSRTHVKR